MKRFAAALAVGLLVLAPATSGNRGAHAAEPCLQSAGGIDLTTATIAELTDAMARGALTSAALVDAYLARIAAYDDVTRTPPNSIRFLNPNARAEAAALDAERAAGRVRGPLHGVPVLLKDNINTVDQPTTAGSIALELNVPKRDATVTKRLRAAGAVILGKANLAEFANWVSRTMPNGYSSLGGQVLSAYNGSNPSGSSSGSAVAMSLAFAGATIGSETAGSIISPSSYAGRVGVKPTMGLVPRTGVIPLADSWDTTGPMVNSVADAALIMDVIAGPDPEDSVTTAAAASTAAAAGFRGALTRTNLQGVRIGYDPTGPGLFRPGSTTGGPAFQQALVDLANLGATIVQVPGLRAVEAEALSELGAIFNQFKAGLNHYLATEAGPATPVRTLSEVIAFNNRHPDKVKYGQDFLIASDATPGSAPLGAAQALPTITSTSATLNALFTANDLDAVVAPGDTYSYHAAASHWASLVVPSGMNGTSPEGLMFVGPPFTDAALMSYAAVFEPLGRRRVPSPTAVNTALVTAACATVAARATTSGAPAPAPAAAAKGDVLPRTGVDAPIAVASALVALAIALRWWGRQESNPLRAA